MFRTIRLIFTVFTYLFSGLVVIFFVYLIAKNPNTFFSNIHNPLMAVYFIPSIVCFGIAHWADKKEKINRLEKPDSIDPFMYEVGDILDELNQYIDLNSPVFKESFDLDAYQYAVLDITLRRDTDDLENLHTHKYKNRQINCGSVIWKPSLCYCHHFINDLSVRDHVKQISKYIEAAGCKSAEDLKISEDARQILNLRFKYFFNNKFDLETKPHLALEVIRIAGNEFYKPTYLLSS